MATASENALHMQQRSHIVLFTYEAWGHARPMCDLAARIVRLRASYVTFFVAEGYVERVKKELIRSFGPEEEGIVDRVRVVGLSKGDDPLDFSALDAAYATAYGRLVESESVACASTGTSYASVPAPDAAIIDLLAVSQLEVVRRLSKKPVKVFAWYTASAAAFCQMYIPEISGKEDVPAKVATEAQSTGKPLKDVAAEAMFGSNGSLFRIPGLPPMYDHEFYPQDVCDMLPLFVCRSRRGRLPLWRPRHSGMLGLLASFKVLEACDGIVATTARCYEAETLHVVSQALAVKSQKVHVCGPLVPPETENSRKEGQPDKTATAARFLDRMLDIHGPQSLVYISFGSMFWPSQPEKVWAILDILMETNAPFILSHASPWAVIPEDVAAKVNDYGLGLLCAWSPQQLILAHPATAWFLTHCGHNSVLESLRQGVPMICWPFGLDQPANAAYLSGALGVAYELFAVRSGRGLAPVHRLGKAPRGTVDAVRAEAQAVFAQAFGGDGAQKRAHAQALRAALTHAWEDGGAARRELESFLDALHDSEQ